MQRKPKSEIDAIKARWCGLQCYLDDKLAIISGRNNDFATIGTLDGKHSVEFSWQAVNSVMYGKMIFRS